MDIGAIPVRMCLACHTRRPANELIRLCRSGERLVRVDLFRRFGGRGAHLCPNARCCEEATRKGRLSRALKTSRLALPSRELSALVRQALDQGIKELFSKGERAGMVQWDPPEPGESIPLIVARPDQQEGFEPKGAHVVLWPSMDSVPEGVRAPAFVTNEAFGQTLLCALHCLFTFMRKG